MCQHDGTVCVTLRAAFSHGGVTRAAFLHGGVTRAAFPHAARRPSVQKRSANARGVTKRHGNRLAACGSCAGKMEYMIELEDGTVLDLPEDKWTAVIKSGLDVCGFSGGQNVRNITLKEA